MNVADDNQSNWLEKQIPNGNELVEEIHHGVFVREVDAEADLNRRTHREDHQDHH